MSGKPVRIAVVSDGVSGAMAAAVLAVELRSPHFQLTIVPAGSKRGGLDSIAPIEATDPSIRRIHARIGLSDSALVQDAGASFTLGVAYAGWSRRRPAYFSPFGDIGAAIDGVQFHQLIARLRNEGGEARPGDFSLATLLAQAGRFCHPSDDPASPLSTFSYGLHAEPEAYSNLLINVATRHGANVLDRGLKRVELGESGQIQALVGDDDERLPVDFVVDASAGGQAIATVDAGWQSWSDLLPCDRAVHIRRPDSAPPSPYSLVEAHSAGWTRTIPCQDGVSETWAYSSNWLDQASFEQRMVKLAGSSPQTLHSQFEAGRRKAPWSRNCIAIGTAACVLETLHPGPTILFANSIERLLRLFPSDPRAEVEAREYNRETTGELDRTRDFVLLRYLINGRAGDPFWDEARNIAPTSELERKIAAYRSRGVVPMVDGDLFDEADWALMFDENGIDPARNDVLADSMTAHRLTALLDRMRGLLTATAAAQPLHSEYLTQLRQKAAA
jgi:tryptophan 7-halogenase